MQDDDISEKIKNSKDTLRGINRRRLLKAGAVLCEGIILGRGLEIAEAREEERERAAGGSFKELLTPVCGSIRAMQS